MLLGSVFPAWHWRESIFTESSRLGFNSKPTLPDLELCVLRRLWLPAKRTACHHRSRSLVSLLEGWTCRRKKWGIEILHRFVLLPCTRIPTAVATFEEGEAAAATGISTAAASSYAGND
jgi:hypothetical protein